MDALEIVARLGASQFPEKLVSCLAEVADEVRKHAKGTKGKVTVKFEIENADGDLGIYINDSYKIDLPSRDGLGAFFFAHDGLHKTDPRRPEFLFRTVDQDTGEIREPELPAQTVRESE